MTTLTQNLQRLLDKEFARPATKSVMLQVKNGNGSTLFSGSAGAAAANDPFFIASISKTYTAALIMQLVDSGAISLDQTVQSLLPDIDLSDLHTINGVAYGPQLSVRHLLHQTSGLADYFTQGLLQDVKRNKDQSFAVSDVLLWSKQIKPQALPDTGRSYYSDTNYQLLGAMIEAVSGRPYNGVLQERICSPLGLEHTAVCGHGKPVSEVVPLFYKDTKINLPLSLQSMGADGGIVSTMSEVSRFLAAFFAGELFDPAHLAVMQQWNRLSFPLQYGYGLMRCKLPRWMTLFRDTPALVGHSGATGSFAFHVPRDDLYLVGSFNQLDQARRPFTGFLMNVLKSVEKHADGH